MLVGRGLNVLQCSLRYFRELPGYTTARMLRRYRTYGTRKTGPQIRIAVATVITLKSQKPTEGLLLVKVPFEQCSGGVLVVTNTRIAGSFVTQTHN